MIRAIEGDERGASGEDLPTRFKRNIFAKGNTQVGQPRMVVDKVREGCNIFDGNGQLHGSSTRGSNTCRIRLE